MTRADAPRQPDSAADRTTASSDAASARASAAARWFADHGDLLWRFALARTRSRDVAEEIVQETLLAAIENMGSLREGSSERAWLLSIAAHKIADHFRRARRTASLDQVREPDTASGPGITGIFTASGFWTRRIAPWGQRENDPGETAELLAALRTCLDSISPSLAEVIWLRDLLEVPGDEVCKVMSLTPTNLWTRTHRARSALRLCVERAIGAAPQPTDRPDSSRQTDPSRNP